MKNKRGFTLIELMITVAIIGIIAAFAYPSYREQVLKSRRADVKAVILQAAQAAERYYTSNYTFGSSSSTAAEKLVVFGGISKSPIDGAGAYYNLTYTVTASDFTITATPTSEGGQTDDKCGTIGYTRAGVVTYNTTTGTLKDCWR